ncbi:MAG: metal ABC transporter substrate-binding protein [Saprospiraceae bacterium]|nr:metal ABC transporter substrate-binding protein [Saprospiraceae bacterium]
MRSLVIGMLLLTSSVAIAQKPKVIASASIFADMAQTIAGDLAEIKSVVPIGGDPHRYEPTPGDAKLVQNADLILINGLTFEGWMQELIENSGTKGKTILITKNIIPIASDLHAGATDPHAWMTASNGLIYIKNIYEALSNLLPENKEELTKNYNAYKAQLEALDAEIFSLIRSIPEGQRVLVTSHDAFNYYGSRYGLTLSAVMGISTESDAQTADMKRVINNIKEFNVPAIFIESTINPKLIQQIATDLKVKIGGELYADSVGEPGSDGDTYIKMLRHNSKTIAEALSGTNFASTKLNKDAGYLNSGVIFGIIAFLLFSILYMIFKLDSTHAKY